MLKKCLCLGLLLVMALPSIRIQAQNDATTATLEPYNGLIQYISADDLADQEENQPVDEALWQLVTEPITVKPGDHIRTGQNGWAELIFFDGVYSEILGNSYVIIKAVESEDAGSFRISFDLLVGETLNVVDKTLDDNSDFQINMPGATASVRGTVWFTKVMPTGCSFIYTQQGSVATVTPAQSEPRLITPEDNGIIYAVDGVEDTSRPDWIPDRVLAIQETSSDTAASSINLVLASVNCGNGELEEGEEGVCDLDENADLPGCGDGYCDYAGGEGLLTCPNDCSPLSFISDEELENRLIYPPGDERNNQ